MSIRDLLTHHTVGGSLPQLDIPLRIQKDEPVILAFPFPPNNPEYGLNSVVVTSLKSQKNYIEFLKVVGLDEILNEHFKLPTKDSSVSFISTYVVPQNAIDSNAHALDCSRCYPQILKITSKKFLESIKKAFQSHQSLSGRVISNANPLVVQISRSGEGFLTQYNIATIGGLRLGGVFPMALDALDGLNFPTSELEILEAIADFKQKRNE